MTELGLLVVAKDKASGVLSGVSSAVSGLGGVASTVATGGLAALAAGLAGIAAGGIATGKAVVDFTTDLNEGLRTSQAQLGLTEDEMDGLRDSARAVFEEGFGDDIGDVVEDMSEVRRVTGLTGDELERATKQAQIIADTFELDVAESVMIADSAVSSGLVPSVEEANDLLTKGFQMGLAEDFGDTINEYSGDFARLGFNSSQVLSMMNAGLEAGAHNTDVIADGFREMNIRLMEGGDGVQEAFSSMGLSFDEMQSKVASGDATWGDFTEQITSSLADMDDSVARNAAGVEIFGSKWEDIGEDVFLAAGQAQEGVEGVSGATDEAGEALSEGFGEAVKRLKRTVISNFDPLGEKVTDTIDKMTPFLDDTTEWLGEKIPEAIDWLEGKWNRHFPAMRDGLLNFWHKIKPGIDWVRTQFNNFTRAILPHLRDAWDSVSIGWEYAKGLINDDLKPAIMDLIDALGLGSLETDGIGESMGDFIGFLINTGVKGIIIGVGEAIKGISAAARTAKGFVDSFKRGLDGVRDAAQWVKNRINDLKHAMSTGWDWVPDWLIPGSPTPFETGLRGIADAAQDLERMDVLTAPPSLATGGNGGGGRLVINNHFGAGSVRSDQDILDIADQIARQTRLRTGDQWL